MDTEENLEIFDPSAQTALVCIDLPELLQLAIEQLEELNYRIHTGLYLDDIVHKLRTHAYDVVVLAETLHESEADTQQILAEILAAAPEQRRKQCVVLVGESFNTGDDLHAFLRNVDLVVAQSDFAKLRPVLRRAVVRNHEFYAPMHEAQKAVDLAIARG